MIRPLRSRQASTLRRSRRQEPGLEPVQVVLVVALLLVFCGGGWLAWQNRAARLELGRARETRNELTRHSQELLAKQQRGESEKNLLPRAAGFGLYPPRPDQLRKQGAW